MVSAVVEKALTYRHSFTGNETDFRRWITFVVRNHYIDLFRYKKKLPQDSLSDLPENFHPVSKGNFSVDLDNKALLDEILSFVRDSFTIQYHDIFTLFFLKEYKIKEVVDELKLPDGTVKGAIFRIRKAIEGKFLKSYKS